MKAKSFSFSSTPCMIVLTALAGYLNAYTFVRFGFMATMNTGNLTRIGISLGDYTLTLSAALMLPFILPVIGTILGSFFTTVLSHKNRHLPYQSYQFTVLCILSAGLLLLSLSSQDASYAPLFFVSVLAGMLLGGFRKWGKIAHNLTIATGNMRNIGEFWADYCCNPSHDGFNKALRYTGMVLIYPTGALLGTAITMKMGAPAIWIGSVSLVLILLYSLHTATLVESK